MHYIEYIPGTIARITDKPTRHGHEDVNLLSRYVVEFNEFNSVYYTTSAANKVAHFVKKFRRFYLPCSS